MTDIITEPTSNPEVSGTEDLLAEFKKLAGDNFKDVTEKWEQISKEADKYIRENPGKAVLGALGIGLVLGLILKD